MVNSLNEQRSILYRNVEVAGHLSTFVHAWICCPSGSVIVPGHPILVVGALCTLV